MIKRSRRRRELDASDRLEFHRALVSARRLHLRLLAASVGALIAAVLGWALGLSLETRALFLIGGTGIFAALPVQSGERWALGWIRREAGLAYQTALELDGRDDVHGFSPAVRDRAKASVRRLTPPTHSPWWLPLFVIAFGALLLPSLPSIGVPGIAGRPGGGGSSPSTRQFEQRQDEREAGPEDSTSDLTRPDRLQEQQRRGAANEGNTDAGPSSSASEQQVLDRFLENLRARPSAPDQEDARSEEQQPGRTPENTEDERRQSRQGDGGEGERRPAEAESADRREPQAGEGEQAEQRAGELEEQSRQDGADGESSNPFAQAGQEETPQEGEESRSESEGEDAPDDLRAGEEDGSPNDGQLSGEQEPEQGPGQGASGQPGGERPAGIAQGEGEKLFVPGDLRSGPMSMGGAAQLPGEGAQALPSGRSPESYRQEAERAVNEGRIPLEYQEVIRNYFR